jgi:hypothetical protein
LLSPCISVAACFLLEAQAVALLQDLRARGVIVEPGSSHFEVYRLAVERYSLTKSADGTLPDSLLSNVREFFLIVYELADYKLNTVPRLQEKQTGF